MCMHTNTATAKLTAGQAPSRYKDALHDPLDQSQNRISLPHPPVSPAPLSSPPPRTMSGHWIQLARLAVFGTVSVLAIIVMGLAAGWIASTEKELDSYFAYAALAVAVPVLTLFTVPPMLVVDLLRRGAFTSMILVEVVWLGILWVLWLATAAYAADQLGGFGGSCHSRFYPSWWTTGCSETQAITAFSFLIWLALLGYWIALVTIASISATRGAPGVWYASVRDAQFDPSTNKVDLTGAMGSAEHKGEASPVAAAAALPQGYPPAPQPAGPQPGYQPTQM
ncbi:MARVEL domain-containing protein [Phanerochaete sordida]|uniref:MARVEL domain-containing protein n=1 Tax=Phanerochaete sordida TaxID=48140 RepID=A0A9P3FYK2_9APHY|nr:MARVEL domain-containing protein [Phanerochaete sordida]